MNVSCAGLVKGILKSSTYAQCLLQADKHTSEAKGTAVFTMAHTMMKLCTLQGQPLLQHSRGYDAA